MRLKKRARHEPAHGEKPTIDRVSGGVLNAAAILGLICIVVAVIAFAAGARLIIFTSESMAPQYPVGSLAMTVPVPADQIRVGDVVSMHRSEDEKLVTHRVSSIELTEGDRLFTLRGDANEVADTEPYVARADVQRMLWVVPGAGTAVTAMKNPLLLVAGAALLLVLAIPTNAKGSSAARRAAQRLSPKQNTSPA